MNTRAVDFVVYTVTDMERAVAFYRDTLGVRFPLVQTGYSGNRSDRRHG